jgi:DNA-binding PadR family transcriptional regulator
MFKFGNSEFSNWFQQFMPKSTPFGDFKATEIRDLLLLWAIQQEKEGVTGYTLSSYFGVPLTNVYRILDKFVDAKKPLLKTEEAIKDGRAQKLYKITDEGNKYLNKLKEEWAGKVSFLQGITGFCAPFPFRRQHHPKFKERILKIEGREDALKFLKVYQDSFDNRIQSLETTIESLKEAKKKINEAVETVKSQDDFSPKIFVEIVSSIYEDIEKEVRTRLHAHRSPHH